MHHLATLRDARGVDAGYSRRRLAQGQADHDFLAGLVDLDDHGSSLRRLHASQWQKYP
jgi:hypothetical protein